MNYPRAGIRKTLGTHVQRSAARTLCERRAAFVLVTVNDRTARDAVAAAGWRELGTPSLDAKWRMWSGWRDQLPERLALPAGARFYVQEAEREAATKFNARWEAGEQTARGWTRTVER